jgi:HEAT repeat protein
MGRGRRTALACMTAAILVLAAGGFVSRKLILEEWLIHRLGSSDEATRKDAAERLARMGAVRTIPHLFRALEPRLREKLIGMERSRHPPTRSTADLDLLLEEAEPSKSPLILAIEKLLNERRAIPILAAMLADEDGTCRRFAVQGLKRYGGEARGVIPRLRPLLCRDDEPDRVEAAWTIVEIEPCDAEAIAFLIRSLTGKSGELAGKILSRLPPSCTAPHLIEALDGEDGSIALPAVEALEGNAMQMGDVKPVLEGLLASIRTDTRLLSARVLLRIDHRHAGAIEILARAFEDGDVEVRRLAAECLASRPLNNQFVTPLLGALGDPDPIVRARAARAIMKTYPYPKEAFPLLRSLKDDGDASVRGAAALALMFMRAR